MGRNCPIWGIRNKHADININSGSRRVNVMGILKKDIPCCGTDDEIDKPQSAGYSVDL